MDKRVKEGNLRDENQVKPFNEPGPFSQNKVFIHLISKMQPNPPIIEINKIDLIFECFPFIFGLIDDSGNRNGLSPNFCKEADGL